MTRAERSRAITEAWYCVRRTSRYWDSSQDRGAIREVDLVMSMLQLAWTDALCPPRRCARAKFQDSSVEEASDWVRGPEHDEWCERVGLEGSWVRRMFKRFKTVKDLPRASAKTRHAEANKRTLRRWREQRRASG